jgi:hypothetical protein
VGDGVGEIGVVGGPGAGRGFVGGGGGRVTGGGAGPVQITPLGQHPMIPLLAREQ